MGYHRAGFDVVGVDIEPQPHYPFEFHQADAMTFPLAGFDVIHASPPCQGYSRLRHLPWLRDRKWPLLIDPLRERLKASGVLYTIENVEDAPLSGCGILLCGLSFGLPVFRHRAFETNFGVLAPPHEPHRIVIGHGRKVNDGRKGTLNAGSAKGAWGNQKIITVAGGQFKKADGERALGIDWMRKDELAQAIPPAYTEFIGRQVMGYIVADQLHPVATGAPFTRVRLTRPMATRQNVSLFET
jgi:DNA (cytosine-5)-methyltransferase 1